MGNLISSSCQYTPISSPRTIRLLHLHPGQQNDQITFSLQTVSLDDSNVSYEAISYCWGDPKLVAPVYCHSQPLYIPQSLYAVLKQLRLPPGGGDRVLWADSICINQRDNVEKGHQVAMMDLIYSRPTRVLIWLGAESNDIIGVRESIRQVSALLPDEEYDADELVRKSREFHAGL